MKYAFHLGIVLLAFTAGLATCCGDDSKDETQSGATVTYTYADLIWRMIDLEALAGLPVKGEKTAQWSSYDRTSSYDPESASYLNWDANEDGSGFMREEGDLLVLAEMEGPGVIWRIWSPIPGDGHVMIYLDGSREAVIDLPFSEYFTGENPPFIFPSMVYSTKATGHNIFIPIPYRKSCRILAESTWGAYNHFTYSTFPKGTTLPTFQGDLPEEALAALNEVEEFFTNGLGSDPAGERVGEQTEDNDVTVEAGGTVTVFELAGEKAITALKVRMSDTISDVDLKFVLRELALRITWDGEESPSVWAPLGDFFGSAPGFASYKSLPLGMTEEGYYSYWYMPFSESAKVEVINDGDTARLLHLEITHAPLAVPASDLGRFHAKWHLNAFLPDETGREIDWTMLKTEGRGRFVGTVLHVWNPQGGWWGEGDEKFFVDGEKFPSIFGTGTEDYFGYGWCCERLFNHPYHSQTVGVEKNPCGYEDPEDSGGHTSVNRWQIVENAPFHVSLEASIEKYFPDSRGTLYANTVYWYLAPGGVDPYEPVPVDERIEYYQETQ